jgi:hypothetical protein
LVQIGDFRAIVRARQGDEVIAPIPDPSDQLVFPVLSGQLRPPVIDNPSEVYVGIEPMPPLFTI